MTDRTARALSRDASTLAIGPSRVTWNGTQLVVHIQEVGAPLPRPIRGTVTLTPTALTGRQFALDAAARHRWSPIAPVSRVEVALDRPALRWSGAAYLDTNDGDRPLEADFHRWDWCRAPLPDGAAILYNAERREGGEQSLALRIGTDGQVDTFEPPPRATLPPTFWRIARPTRAEAPPRLVETLTDAPFYARSVIATRLLGQNVTAVHESLEMARFTAPWVQVMLPFRVPRRW